MKSDPRRMNYPFTSCVDCGPRYTVITSLPYDRPRTVMNEFPLCDDCKNEYTNPTDRRFHAQTTCCWLCGPQYYLLDKNGNLIISKEDFQRFWQEIPKLINESNIIAIKGIGGTHIACGTLSDDPISTLREWKGARGEKPFAVMAAGIEKVRSFAYCSDIEAKFLESLARPILLLEKNHDYSLSSLISPNLHNIGVLLPYTGIHHLLMEKINDPAIVMTSGNPSNIPILIKNEIIQNQLSSIVDYFLIHDRQIFQRADDSVMRLHRIDKEFYPLLIRRSRGFVPEPINLPWSSTKPTVLALGAEMYSIGALGIGKRCFPTQYIGHMTTLENFDFLNQSINHLKNLLGVASFEGIGGDLHPNFLTTKLGEDLSEELELPFYQFQHHFAHLSALAIDANVSPEDEIICVALDGTGYGEDGTIWGGEILVGNFSDYRRVAHLEHQILLGGDVAVSQPYRILLSTLLHENSFESITSDFQSLPWLTWIPKNPEYPIIGKELLKMQSSLSIKNYNLTSSCGRLLDAISVLLGASKQRTYEGEPAIKLESFAERAIGKSVEFDLNLNTRSVEGGMVEIKTSDFVNEIWNLIKDNKKISELALAAEKTIAKKFAEVAVEIAYKTGVSNIGLSGGVSFNRIIFSEFYKHIRALDKKITLIFHRKIPCGDGGIAIGQVPLIQSNLF
jgi:hydrogenase maturation protein HypF